MSDDKPVTPTEDAAGADNPTAENAGGKTFTQDELNAILADRLERQKKKLLAELEQRRDEEATKQLEEAAEWQKLAEKRQKQLQDRDVRLAELEAQAGQADKYSKALETYVTALSDGLPDAIMTLLASMDTADRLTWLTANRDQFVQQPTDEPEAKKRPLPSTPAPTPAPKLNEDDRRKKAARTW